MGATEAALAYAEHGWYVVPVARGTKNPGSVLGKSWQTRSTRDPRTIVALWSGTNHGIALHAGRSGAVVFDVDRPELLPESLMYYIGRAAVLPPAQRTRERAASGQGHYLFVQPPGRDIGNSTGELDGRWGEVRGRNGVIVVAPSEHPDAAAGGRYEWLRGGEVPLLPEGLAAALPDAGAAAEGVVPAAILENWLNVHVSGTRLDLIEAGPVADLRERIRAGESRHESAVTAACWAAREAAAGIYPARVALAALWPVFRDAIRGERDAGAEWRGIVGWAVAQSGQVDPVVTRGRVLPPDPFGVPDDWAVPAGAEPAEPQVSRMRARLYRRDELDRIPSPVPLIADVLDVGTLALLSGKFGTYKTFVSIAWACAVATGQAWLGHAVPAARPVLYIAAEGATGIRSRVEAWELAHGEKAVDLWVYDGRIKLADEGELTELAAMVRETSAGLIVVDTLHKAAPGLEENSSKDMSTILDAATRLREWSGATLLFNHHTGHGGERSRGSSSLEDDVDTSWVIRLGGDPEDRSAGNQRMLTHRKTKNGALVDEVPLILKADGDHAYVTGGEVESAMMPGSLVVGTLISWMEELHMPLEWGKSPVRQALKDAGRSVPRDQILAEAIKVRKERAKSGVLLVPKIAEPIFDLTRFPRSGTGGTDLGNDAGQDPFSLVP
jgi:AAA domain/Bifunctional DNA primase/polymerase, N-terminal